MSRATRLLTLALLTGAACVAGGGDARAQGSNCYYLTVEGGATKVVCEPMSYVDIDVRWDCLNGPCEPCGSCHTGAVARSRTFDRQLHVTKAFPRHAIAAPVRGRDIEIGLDGGRLCALDARRRPVHCYPAGAVVLKDSRGQPALIFSRRR